MLRKQEKQKMASPESPQPWTDNSPTQAVLKELAAMNWDQPKKEFIDPDTTLPPIAEPTPDDTAPISIPQSRGPNEVWFATYSQDSKGVIRPEPETIRRVPELEAGTPK